MKNKQAFTLTELILGVSISAIVLLVVLTFMANVMSDFGKSQKKTQFIANFYEFSSKVDKYRLIFGSGQIIDNASTHDALLLYSPGGLGVLIGVLDSNTLQLDSIGAQNTYGSKLIGYKDLSVSQVDTIINTNSGAIYSYDFFRDKVFEDIYVSDFQLTPYNSGAIFNLDLDIILYYKPDLDNTSISDMPVDDVFRTVLTF